MTVKRKKKIKSLYQKNIYSIKIGYDIWWLADNKVRFMCVNRYWHPTNNLIACREEFQFLHKRSRRMIISHPLKAGNNIAAFVRKVEEKLGVKPFSVIGATNKGMFSWIYVSPFWSPWMRKSLFTALLRTAVHYDKKKDNFNEALFIDEYMFTTLLAVKRFLDGYTHYTEKIEKLNWKFGWVDQFKNIHADKLNMLLIKP